MESAIEVVILLIILAATVPSNCFETKTNGTSRLTTATINGDEYSCVDIYKQPSLKHPALKDPQVKDRIYKYLDDVIAKMMHSNDVNLESSNAKGIWINDDEGCPIGTVPIPRNHQNLKFTLKPFSNHSLIREKTMEFAGIGLVSTPGTDTEEYTGAWATINLYNPHVADKSYQFTAASILLEVLDNKPYNQIQVGWMVHPNLYGDQRTRLYTAWTADDYQHTGCYNTKCKGFIQLNHKIPLGYAYPKISRPDHEQFDSQFIVKTMKEGGWEFYTGDPPELIGHWPDYLFTSMKHSAKQVLFGGQAHARLTDPTTPPMGSGQFNNDRNTCYMRNVYVGNRNQQKIQPQSYLTYLSHSRCYLAGSNQSTNEPFWNYRFLFGGTGGVDGQTCV